MHKGAVAGGRRGGGMITPFRIGLIALGWIAVQVVLIADLIYRVAQYQM